MTQTPGATATGATPGAAPGPGLAGLTLAEASQAVHSRKASPVELTQACLARTERLNPRLNAFITVTAESALAEARAAERG